MYYADKVSSLRELFGAEEVSVEAQAVVADGRRYPVVDDVVILADSDQYTPYLRERLRAASARDPGPREGEGFARDVQAGFGAEWTHYGAILPEHEREFLQYFDLVDLSFLRGRRVCDLGCGNGRWSYFLQDRCRELVLVDFSDAIFVARRNLSDARNALFFLGDLKRLPFRDDFADFLFCLGVLHHLPTPVLDEVRALKRFSPELLVYLYYALDNRPFYFRWILKAVTGVRRVLCGIESPGFRKAFSVAGTYGVYLPLVGLGKVLKPLGLSSRVPLYDGYHDKSAKRIEQDVYDRFFTRIEQRVARKDILALKDVFSSVTVADNPPYWHFLCRR
jgi:SAM-dependent methyltransferase